ncbi:MAG: matrixin family metalloprotease [Verrucomicrobiaceae bacterium]
MMSRFLVLLLPLATLWLVWPGGSGSTLRPEKISSPSPGPASPNPTSRASDFAPNPSPPGHTVAGPVFQSVPIPAFNRNPAPAPHGLAPLPSGKKRHPHFAHAWSTIDPALLAELPRPRQQHLASYLDSLLKGDPNDQRWLCWGPGTSLATVMAYHQAEKSGGLATKQLQIKADQFLGQGRWSRVAHGTSNNLSQGRPITITWSIVPDGTPTPNTDQDLADSDFRSWMQSLYGGDATAPAASQPWFPLISDAFAAMEAECGINFIYEPNDDGASVLSQNRGVIGIRGDIRLSARFVDGNSSPFGGNNVLAFAFAPDHGDIIFDSGDSFFDSTNQNSIRLHNVTTHELGHALGLAHVCPINRTKLMEPFAITSFRGPQFDETYSLQRQYGDPLENTGGSVSNDRASSASPITPLSDVPLTLQWLSIDDNADLDYLRFPAKEFQNVQAIISPNRASYQEGPQTESCSTAPLFNPSSQHDLTLELLDQNGSTVLATSDSGGLGEGESILDFPIDEDGDYYLRINGGGDNTSQTYSLTLLVGGAPPKPEVEFLSSEIIAESGVTKNGRPDPGESIRIRLGLLNSGTAATQNLIATPVPTAGMTVFTSGISFPTINPGKSATVEIDLAIEGPCGRPLELPFQITDDSGLTETIRLPFQLGILIEDAPIEEKFDLTSTLPTGWSTSTTDAGTPWFITDSLSESGNRSAFAAGVAGTSTATLLSPPLELKSGTNVLRFFHHFDTELRWDGGVLEASLDEGPWFDLPTHPDITVESGGYIRALSSSARHPLAGRQTWTGDSAKFIATELALPDEWASQSLRLRWILAHDRSVNGQGWAIDSLSIEGEIGSCEPHLPLISLTSSLTQLDENNPDNSVTLTLSSEVPLLTPLEIPLTLAGTANLSDITTLTPLLLPAGQKETTFTIRVAPDDLVEGAEQLILSLPQDQLIFAPSQNSSVTLNIVDREDFQSWSLQYPASPPGGDLDHDGLPNLGEYLLGLDPSTPDAPPLNIDLSPTSTTVRLNNLPDRNDAQINIQVSSDLSRWTTVPLTKVENGLQIPRDDSKRYLRLIFSINQ